MFKTNNMKNSLTIVLFSLYFLIFPQMVYAYLDPGTGSLIIQMIVSVLVGASFVIGVSWKKIKIFFTTHFLKRKKDEKEEL